jgi:hypothetical protein
MILLRDSGKPKIVSPGKGGQHGAISHQSNLFTAKVAKDAKKKKMIQCFSFAVLRPLRLAYG